MMAKIYEICVVCERKIPLETRKFKNTCSDHCEGLKQKQIDQRAYAAKMSRDPLYATKQSRKQYASIKADPEKWIEFKKVRDERVQMPSYRESLRKGWKKYKAKNKEKIAEHTRNHRAMLGVEWTESRLRSEAKRIEKRKKKRQWLKDNDPDGYKQLLKEEREYQRQWRKNKRLQKAQEQMAQVMQGDSNEEK